MLEALLFLSVLFVVSLVFALLEIQIEGGTGWAADLPTWRVRVRALDFLFGERPLTGYHVYAFLFVGFAVHVPFLVEPSLFSMARELRLLAFIVLFWVLEDFLWFVMNPSFGLRRFRPEHVWWHGKRWPAFLPLAYWIFLPIGLGLYILSLQL